MTTEEIVASVGVRLVRAKTNLVRATTREIDPERPEEWAERAVTLARRSGKAEALGEFFDFLTRGKPEFAEIVAHVEQQIQEVT